MATNTIFYGPPGTGKTYMMQEIQRKYYTDYSIEDSIIIAAHSDLGQDWLVLMLILLQNNHAMDSTEIQLKLTNLGLNLAKQPTSTLEAHSCSVTPPFTPEQPQIFSRDAELKWVVDIRLLANYDQSLFNSIYNKYLKLGLTKRYEIVTFHQSFAYEDFIEGIRPNISVIPTATDNGTIGYSVQPGVFRRICEKAMNSPEKNYALFIDEINRGNVEEIFGELISLIEPDKRIGEINEFTVTLPYSKIEGFGVPANLDIIGTMNSADRSVDTMDIALRRRFNFEKLDCDTYAIFSELRCRGIDAENVGGVNLIRMIEVINKRIELMIDRNFVIGHAYFVKVQNFNDIVNVLIYDIIPLLEEYFFDDPQKIQIVLNDLDENGDLRPNAIYNHDMLNVTDLISYTGDYEFENKKSFYIAERINVDSVIKIYS